MSLLRRNMKLPKSLPKPTRSIPVFRVRAVPLEERKKAVDLISREVGLGRTLHTAEMEESVHFVSKAGEFQFYRPSGAMWFRNLAIDGKFKDERRPWKTRKVYQKDDRNEFELALLKSVESGLVKEARGLMSKAKLTSRHAYLADVSLEQVVKLDEEGNELERFAGEAVVRFLYKLEAKEVDGPGAKTYAFFNPVAGKPKLTGMYHVWRDIVEARGVKTVGPELIIDRFIATDEELALHHKRKFKIELSSMDLVYFAAPPFSFQEYVFPAYRVVGNATKSGRRKGTRKGFEFARFYHAVPPEEYSKAKIYADYLIARP